MKSKLYTHKDSPFFGIFYSCSPYLVEIDQIGRYRYVHEDFETAWRSNEILKEFNQFIGRGVWVEVKELPQKPWKLK